MKVKCEIKEVEQQSTTTTPNEYSLHIWGTGKEVECHNAWTIISSNRNMLENAINKKEMVMTGKPLVQQFQDEVNLIIDKFRSSGITMAEVIGALEIVKIDLHMEQPE
jgi:uncharacterized protein (DUF433 family)